MNRAKVTVGEIIIPTYPEPPAEEMPMFAENRVHQRTSGRPYPNKVVMQVDRTHKENNGSQVCGVKFVWFVEFKKVVKFLH